MLCTFVCCSLLGRLIIIEFQQYLVLYQLFNIKDLVEERKSEGDVPIEVVTFLPNGEGELKDIPGFGQVLETRSLEDGKVVRYPISTLGISLCV